MFVCVYLCASVCACVCVCLHCSLTLTFSMCSRDLPRTVGRLLCHEGSYLHQTRPDQTRQTQHITAHYSTLQQSVTPWHISLRTPLSILPSMLPPASPVRVPAEAAHELRPQRAGALLHGTEQHLVLVAHKQVLHRHHLSRRVISGMQAPQEGH